MLGGEPHRRSGRGVLQAQSEGLAALVSAALLELGQTVSHELVYARALPADCPPFDNQRGGLYDNETEDSANEHCHDCGGVCGQRCSITLAHDACPFFQLRKASKAVVKPPKSVMLLPLSGSSSRSFWMLPSPQAIPQLPFVLNA